MRILPDPGWRRTVSLSKLFSNVPLLTQERMSPFFGCCSLIYCRCFCRRRRTVPLPGGQRPAPQRLVIHHQPRLGPMFGHQRRTEVRMAFVLIPPPTLAPATPAACAGDWAGPATEAPIPRRPRPDNVARPAWSAGGSSPASPRLAPVSVPGGFTPAIIVNRSRSFRLIFNVSMLWPELLPQPRPKGDILIEFRRAHLNF